MTVERIAPEEGAAVVAFDHAAAAALVEELRAAAASLAEHGAGLAAERRAVVVNWLGAFRDEFEHADALLRRSLADAAGAVLAARRAVHRAVDEANARQLAHNAAARDAPSGGP